MWGAERAHRAPVIVALSPRTPRRSCRMSVTGCAMQKRASTIAMLFAVLLVCVRCVLRARGGGGGGG